MLGGRKPLFGKGLNSNQLKVIAIIAMTIDHVTSVIYSGYPASWPGWPQESWWILLLHIIGRLTAPMMWFFIAEGYYYTKNVKRYAARMFIFAFVSHFAYNFAFGIPFIPFSTGVYINQTSVLWSLAWAIVTLYIYEEVNIKQWQKHIILTAVCIITFCADWSCLAVLSILSIYRYRGNLKKQVTEMLKFVSYYAIGYFFWADKLMGAIQLMVIIVVLFVMLYNGERGKWKGMKWFFYIYYPAHLVLCGFLRLYLHGNAGMIIGS